MNGQIQWIDFVAKRRDVGYDLHLDLRRARGFAEFSAQIFPGRFAERAKIFIPVLITERQPRHRHTWNSGIPAQGKRFDRRAIVRRKILQNDQGSFVSPGISQKARSQRVCHPCFVPLIASAQVSSTGPTTNHQHPHCEETRENFANNIDNGTNFARHAFDKILPNKKHRLDGAHVARIVLEQQIIMFEAAVQRLLDDFVVTVIFTLILKRPFPRFTVLQFS